MDELSRDDVERTARLARLALSDEEVQRLAGELASILGHVREIRRLEEEGEGGGPDLSRPAAGAPDEAAGAEEALRPDEVDPDPLEEPVSELAPVWRDGHFAVPRLRSLGGEEPG